MSEMRRRLFAGWGGTPVSAGDESSEPHALSRGLGRSYGDAALNAGGALTPSPSVGSITLDDVTALCTASGSTTIRELIDYLVPRGFFVPVTPGTADVTVGGAVAADIHGKNHHHDGSWGHHVHSLVLILSDGEEVVLTPADEEFWATIGGMGLTGRVLSCTFSVVRIESPAMVVDTVRTTDLDGCLAALAEADKHHRYSVAWVDLLATGQSLGRSVLTSGDHGSVASPGNKLLLSPLVSMPHVGPMNFMNRATISGFNEVWYRKAPQQRLGASTSIGQFFHPLDGVADWNHFYGTRGFIQYQLVVPFGAERTLQTIIERLSSERVPTFVPVLKRFGAANSGPLSFPIPGWTLTFDIPTAVSGLAQMLDDFDELVIEAGGRIYLAKDARLRRQHMVAMYPRLAEWQVTRNRMDPRALLRSDLGRRLGLVP